MNLKRLYSILLKVITKIMGIDVAKKFDTKLRFRRSINLKNPQNLAEKVTYIELHKQSSLATICTDKYEVRKYIKEKGYGGILVNEVGGPWNCVDDIDFRNFPNSFVLKATHGCKMNYIVQNKERLDELKCKNEMKRWLATTYGTYSVEPHYATIKPRIYAEEYLGEMSKLTDYKFHCLNGIPQFVLTVTERKIDDDNAMKVTLNLFDMNWKSIFEVEGFNSELPGNGKVNKPKHFDEMVKIATDLSQDFDFVRVDLYEVDDKVLFGELTFSPACCVFPYFSEKFLCEMGKKLEI